MNEYFFIWTVVTGRQGFSIEIHGAKTIMVFAVAIMAWASGARVVGGNGRPGLCCGDASNN